MRLRPSSRTFLAHLFSPVLTFSLPGLFRGGRGLCGTYGTHVAHLCTPSDGSGGQTFIGNMGIKRKPPGGAAPQLGRTGGTSSGCSGEESD